MGFAVNNSRAVLEGLFKKKSEFVRTPKYNIKNCLLYTSDAADERSSVDLGGRRIIKKKKKRRASIRVRDNIRNKRSREEQEREHRNQ